MKNIIISDVTLLSAYSSKQSFRDRLDYAKRLDKIKVDYIEVGPIFDSTEGVLVKTISSFLQNSAICCLATNVEEIDLAIESIQSAPKKRIQLCLPASIVQIEYNLHVKPQILIGKAKELVSYAKSKGMNVEVALMDATRSEAEILNKLIEASIEAGCDAITLIDNAGNLFVSEFSAFIGELYNNIEGLKNVELNVQVTNRFKMSTATSIAGVKAGACGIKTQQSAEDCADIVSIFETFRENGDKLSMKVNLAFADVINTLNIAKDNKKVSSKKEENKEIDVSGVEAMAHILSQNGYELSSDDVQKVFDTYKTLRKKKIVGAKELDVIVATVAQQAPETYELVNFVANSGNIITDTTSITLVRDGMTYSGLSAGDGPIDASFKAIENIVGVHYELDEFSIGSITEGREAIGEAIVKLRHNGKIYSGVGISTNIIGASIRAYLSALNKIIYEESM